MCMPDSEPFFSVPKKIIVALVALVLVLGAIAFIYTPELRKQVQTMLGDTITVGVNPSGFIFTNTPSEAGSTFSYYDFASGDFVPYDRPNYYMPTASDDENALLASGLTSDDQGTPYAGLFYLKDGATSDTLIYASSTVDLLQHPQLSPGGGAYTFEVAPSAADGSEKWYTPKNWTIYLGNVTSGTPTPIAHGVSAHFSPDSTVVLYVGSDGLRTRNIVTGNDDLVVPFNNGGGNAYLMTDVSRDGSRFAISNPVKGTVSVYGIAGWHPFSLADSVAQFDIQAFWPVFSPDGLQLAVEQVDWNIASSSGSSANNARLTVLNLSTHAMDDIADWSGLDASKIGISDWLTEN